MEYKNDNYWYFRFCHNLIYDNDFQALVNDGNVDGKINAYIILNVYLIAIKTDNKIKVPNETPDRRQSFLQGLATNTSSTEQELDRALRSAERNNVIRIYVDGNYLIIDCYKLDNYVGKSSYSADYKRKKRLEEKKDKKLILGRFNNVFLFETELEQIKSMDKRYAFAIEERSVKKALNKNDKLNDFEEVKRYINQHLLE